jgi:hypothetical protein
MEVRIGRVGRQFVVPSSVSAVGMLPPNDPGGPDQLRRDKDAARTRGFKPRSPIRSLRPLN